MGFGPPQRLRRRVVDAPVAIVVLKAVSWVWLKHLVRKRETLHNLPSEDLV